MMVTSMRLLVFLCLLWLTMNPAFAQPLIDKVQSIDCQVINADYVYVAKIIKVRDEPIPGGSEMPGFTFEVEEALKTPAGESIDPLFRKRAMFVTAPTTKYKDWMNRSSRLLIISSSMNDYRPTVIELTSPKAVAFTADLKVLKDPEAIIQAAKDAIARTPKNVSRLHTHSITLAPKTYQGTPWEKGMGLSLEVPADAKLEQWALNSLSNASPAIRFEAVTAMYYFHSDKNAERLAKLLTDPAAHLDDEDGKKVRHFYIREEAYRVFQHWGVDVKQPVLRIEAADR